MSYYLTGYVVGNSFETVQNVYKDFDEIGAADFRKNSESSGVVDVYGYIDDISEFEEILLNIKDRICEGSVCAFDEGDSSFFERFKFLPEAKKWIFEEGVVLYKSDFENQDCLNEAYSGLKSYDLCLDETDKRINSLA